MPLAKTAGDICVRARDLNVRVLLIVLEPRFLPAAKKQRIFCIQETPDSSGARTLMPPASPLIDFFLLPSSRLSSRSRKRAIRVSRGFSVGGNSKEGEIHRGFCVGNGCVFFPVPQAPKLAEGKAGSNRRRPALQGGCSLEDERRIEERPLPDLFLLLFLVFNLDSSLINEFLAF